MTSNDHVLCDMQQQKPASLGVCSCNKNNIYAAESTSILDPNQQEVNCQSFGTEMNAEKWYNVHTEHKIYQTQEQLLEVWAKKY